MSSKHFSAEDDEMLISEVSICPQLHNHEDKDYKNLEIRENIWKKVSISLKTDRYSLASAVTTIHHDKPEESRIANMAIKMKDTVEIINTTLSPSERQKRLLPYENFYLAHPFNRAQNPPDHGQYLHQKVIPKKQYNRYDDTSYQFQDMHHHTNIKFTPFLESNALPGPFRPITNAREPQYVTVLQPQKPKVPNYSVIYDKLSQLKLSYRRPSVQSYRPNPPQRYIIKPPVNYEYKTIQPSKTSVETYTATEIDLSNSNGEKEYKTDHQNAHIPSSLIRVPYKNNKPFVNSQIAVEIPQNSYTQDEIASVSLNSEPIVRKPYIIVEARPPNTNTAQKPYIVIRQKPGFREKERNVPKYIPVPQYQPTVTANYESRPTYEVTPEYEVPAPITEPTYQISTENTNSLTQLLKQLQATNTLPKTLTADNIDNSIKTLVRILEALKKQRKFTKPIVVPEEVSTDYDSDIENEAGVGISGHGVELPGIVSESFPGDTPEGGTPGKPGVDYPALSTIPQTSFNCKTQRYKGFFGDPDTNCQVWHYCDLNGGQSSFLCPNGTIFSQVALTCDWWYNVKCATTAQLYVLNERLYKYIIPLSPKFPEDYTGPLVDKYLALKFQEMEEKMKKEKKGKGNADKEKVEEVQNIDKKTKEIMRANPTTMPPLRETLETIEDDNDSDQ